MRTFTNNLFLLIAVALVATGCGGDKQGSRPLDTLGVDPVEPQQSSFVDGTNQIFNSIRFGVDYTGAVEIQTENQEYNNWINSKARHDDYVSKVPSKLRASAEDCNDFGPCDPSRNFADVKVRFEVDCVEVPGEYEDIEVLIVIMRATITIPRADGSIDIVEETHYFWPWATGLNANAENMIPAFRSGYTDTSGLFSFDAGNLALNVLGGGGQLNGRLGYMFLVDLNAGSALGIGRPVYEFSQEQNLKCWDSGNDRPVIQPRPRSLLPQNRQPGICDDYRTDIPPKPAVRQPRSGNSYCNSRPAIFPSDRAVEGQEQRRRRGY